MMHRYVLLFLLLLVAFSSAHAQQESLASATFKQRLRAQYLHNDTAQAIINLYGRRQGGGASWIAGALLSALRIGTASAPPSPSPYIQTDNGSGNLGGALLIATPLIAYGTGKIMHYSNKKLEKVLTAYAAGQPLPRALRRKLAPRFFKQPIIQYEKVKVKPAN